MSMVMTKILIAFFSLLLLLLIINAIVAIFNLGVYYKQKPKLEKYRIDIDVDLSKENKNVLDDLIGDCFQEYIMMNVDFKDGAITSDEEETIVRNVCKNVLDNMSETMIHKIGLFYNTGNLNHIISNKVYLLMMDYSIYRNSPK